MGIIEFPLEVLDNIICYFSDFDILNFRETCKLFSIFPYRLHDYYTLSSDRKLLECFNLIITNIKIISLDNIENISEIYRDRITSVIVDIPEGQRVSVRKEEDCFKNLKCIRLKTAIINFGLNATHCYVDFSPWCLVFFATHLYFGDEIDCDIRCLPESLVHLEFGNNFKSKSLFDFPETLKYLKFGFGCNCNLVVDRLPDSIETLIFSDFFDFQRYIYRVKYPLSLKHLTIFKDELYDIVIPNVEVNVIV